MNDTQQILNPVQTPDQAIAEFVGEQFIEWLMEHIVHQMKVWPAMLVLQNAQVKSAKIKKFMLQRFLAAQAILGAREGDPGFLRFAIANLSESDDPEAESALEILESRLSEELAGHRIERGIVYTAHRELWARLLKALGATDEEIDRVEPKEVTRNYVAELSDVYSSADWQTAVGALAAHERSVPEEYRAILSMLKRCTTLTDKDLEILTTLVGTDNKYAVFANHILDKIVFDPATKQLVWDGALRQLNSRQEFLDGIIKYLEG